MAQLNCGDLAKGTTFGKMFFPCFLEGKPFAITPFLLGLFAGFFAFNGPVGFAQSSTGSQLDCRIPLFSSSAACRGSMDSPNANDNIPDPTGNMGTILPRTSTDLQQVYVDSAGSDSRRSNRSGSADDDLIPPDPPTDFQRLAHLAIGETLPIFGRDFFRRVPSTFAPSDQISGTANYVVGPGDEILVRLSGPETLNSRLTVDASGDIYLPKVGAIHVAGFRYDELQALISTDLSRIYRNFRISISLGRLRSIQIYVVGEARRPGAYTISSLSTILNALFVSGGPNAQGSLRHIQVRRSGQTFPEFDLYDLVLRGDKSKDVRLETGDTIFIPPAGMQVALGGSVRHPAIYELGKETTLGDILALAGGFSATASKTQVLLERIDVDHTRHAIDLAMDDAARAMALKDGDVIFAKHISAGYENSVTIRGNLANPGRFAWHEGMRLSDVIPDRMSLLTNDYWRERDRLGVPVPLFEPSRQLPGNDRRNGIGYLQNEPPLTSNLGSARSPNDFQQNSQGTQLPAGQLQTDVPLPPSSQSTQYGNNSNGTVVTRGTQNQVPPVAASVGSPSQQQQAILNGSPLAQNKIDVPAAEIDWSYAVIERLDPNTLKTSLIPFNLGKLVQAHDPAQNLELRPGDVVTIVSQNDVLTAQETRTKYVRLEGEFIASGVYSVEPNETLQDLVKRAGGLTSKAYLYGSSFNRESSRVFQQQRLDEYLSTLSVDMERAAAVRAASSPSGVLDPNALAGQRSIISQLRLLRATGRVVLEFLPDSVGEKAIPGIPLENGDIFRVPTRPNTVSVLGAVYGQNVFLYHPNQRLADYVAEAGNPNRIADRKHAFIIRADGSIFSRERSQKTFSNSFDSVQINPGDSIVIPEKLIKPTALRELIDYSQVLSSFGLAAAAINVVK